MILYRNLREIMFRLTNVIPERIISVSWGITVFDKEWFSPVLDGFWACGLCPWNAEDTAFWKCLGGKNNPQMHHPQTLARPLQNVSRNCQKTIYWAEDKRRKKWGRICVLKTDWNIFRGATTSREQQTFEASMAEITPSSPPLDENPRTSTAIQTGSEKQTEW